MDKLYRIDNVLYINDNNIILSRWTSNGINNKIIIRDAFGNLIFKGEVPIETQNGIRNNISDIISDITSKWKGVNYSKWYQAVFGISSSEVIQNEDGKYYITNYGNGGSDLDVEIVGDYSLFEDCGVTDNGLKFISPNDSALNTLYSHYPELNVLQYPNEFGYSDLNNISKVSYPQAEIVKTDNAISKLKLPEQEIFNSVPVEKNDKWVFEDNSGNGNDVEILNSNGCYFNNSEVIALSSMIDEFNFLETGFISFYFKSDYDTSGESKCIFSMGKYNTYTDGVELLVGNVTSSYNDESLVFAVKANNEFKLYMALRIGTDYLFDNKTHFIKLIIDGDNNRFEVDGNIYDYDSGHLGFKYGNKTVKYFLNNQVVNNSYIGRVNGLHLGKRLVGIISNFNINDIINIPFSESGTYFDNNKNIINVWNFNKNGFLNSVPNNLINGYSSKILFNIKSVSNVSMFSNGSIDLECILITVSVNNGNILTAKNGDSGIELFAQDNTLYVKYSNSSTTETFETINNIKFRIRNFLKFRYNNGEIYLQINGIEYTFNKTISDFTEEISSVIIGGYVATLFDVTLAVNSKKINTYKIQAKDSLFDINGQRLTNPSREVMGTEINLLLAGQSNMTGMADYNEISNYNYLQVYDNINSFSAGDWIKMMPGTHNGYKDLWQYWGMEWSLMTDLIKKVKTINYLKFSQMGTSLWEDWNRQTGTLYNEMVDTMLLSGKIPDVIVWSQWESDTDTYEHAIAYKNTFIDMFQHFKDNYNKNVKIIISKPSIHTSYNETNRDIIINAFNELLEEGFIHAIIPTDDLPLQPDLHHYTFEGLETEGFRVSEKISELINLELYCGEYIFNQAENTIKGIKHSDWETNEKTFDEIHNIGLISKDDFHLTKEDNCMSKMLSQPYETVYNSEGEIVRNDEGEIVKTLKY